jgi:hypothetical protein
MAIILMKLKYVIFILIFSIYIVFSITGAADAEDEACQSLGSEELNYLAAHMAKEDGVKKEIIECSFKDSDNPDLWRYFLYFAPYDEQDFSIRELKTVVDAYSEYSINNSLKFDYSIDYLKFSYLKLIDIYLRTSLRWVDSCDADITKYIDELEKLSSSLYSENPLASQIIGYRAYCNYRNNKYKQTIENYKEIISMTDDEEERSTLMVYMAMSYLKLNDRQDMFASLEASIDNCIKSNSNKCSERIYRRLMDREFDRYMSNGKLKQLRSILLSRSRNDNHPEK